MTTRYISSGDHADRASSGPKYAGLQRTGGGTAAVFLFPSELMADGPGHWPDGS